MSEIKFGLAGTGTVGGGVVKILAKQIPFFREKLGLPISIARVASKEMEVMQALPTGNAVLSLNAMDIVEDPEIDVVVELIGGTTFAKTLVEKALQKGKHVITANKALVAHFGPELFALADANGVSLYFEAAVGGGMPSIKTIREAFIGNDAVSVNTIINGTCNYILTEMTEKGVGFEETLAIAQELGYAEANPSLDVGGGDTGHKVAIIASLLFGGYVDYDKMSVEGIEDITAQDIIYAKELGYSIKLLGVIKKDENEEAVDVRVNPVMLHNDHILSSVNGVFNAVLLEGDAVGQIMLYGAGAGEMPTASAVISDVVDVARNIKSGDINRIPMSFYKKENELTIKSADEINCRYYLRLSVDDSAGVLAEVADELAKRNISIASLTQKEAIEDHDFVPVIITTYSATEADLKAAITEIEKKPFVKGATKILRIED